MKKKVVLYMRIVVTSDSHRRVSKLIDIIDRHKDDTQLFINLGDGEDDVDYIESLYPKIKIERVCGNCDWNSMLPRQKLITAGGKKIFFTHGHPYHVKYGYTELEQAARQMEADICLFGHTHRPYCQITDGIYYLNPGAVGDGSYRIIDIVDGKILCYNASI